MTETATDLLNFTKAAASKVAELIVGEGDYDLKLRVAIMGGGCSGFQYGFSFVNEQQAGDFVVSETIDMPDSPAGAISVDLLVDPMSLQYLEGATIDYIEDLQGARFTIDNPNATTSCGCGSSFSID